MAPSAYPVPSGLQPHEWNQVSVFDIPSSSPSTLRCGLKSGPHPASLRGRSSHSPRKPCCWSVRPLFRNHLALVLSGSPAGDQASLGPRSAGSLAVYVLTADSMYTHERPVAATQMCPSMGERERLTGAHHSTRACSTLHSRAPLSDGVPSEKCVLGGFLTVPAWQSVWHPRVGWPLLARALCLACRSRAQPHTAHSCVEGLRHLPHGGEGPARAWSERWAWRASTGQRPRTEPAGLQAAQGASGVSGERLRDKDVAAPDGKLRGPRPASLPASFPWGQKRNRAPRTGAQLDQQGTRRGSWPGRRRSPSQTPSEGGGRVAWGPRKQGSGWMGRGHTRDGHATWEQQPD